MPRRLRYIPKPGTLVEVTCRVIHGRKLLRPSKSVNQLIAGVLARVKRRHGVRICAVAYMSSHAHLLVVVDNAQQLAQFMTLVNSKIAREIGKRTGWCEKIWGRRYSAIIVSDEPEAQIARLRYLLSHGVKEHLVGRCIDWPGLHAAASLLTGNALTGYWFDRTAEYRARLRGQRYNRYTYATRESLAFDPLPCWAHLSEPAYRAEVKAIVQHVEREAAIERRRRGLVPLGVKAVLRQNPRQRPKTLERSPAPLCHAWSRQARQALINAYRSFEAFYREAAARLRAGCRDALFPEGCFPPPLPFVPAM